jgi:uncharacterized protein (DUF2141 family)
MAPIRTLKLLAVLALVAPCAVVAQEQTAAGPTTAPAKTGTAQISGVVLDSLHMRYLGGADVLIEGAKESLVTDSLGRFKIEGLPPGTYQVGVFHPVLDTLNTSLATKPFHVGPDSASFIVLSVPSAATIIRNECRARTLGQGHSAVIGHVNDPETLRPVSGAEVSISWMDIAVGKEIGILRTPHLVRDTTDATGAYHLCGLPNSMQATLQARKALAATSEVPVSLGDADSELLMRPLLLSHEAVGVTTGNASVSGIVILEGSKESAGSRVELVGTDVVVLTNEQGEFTMTNVPSGSHLLFARHLGFGAANVAVDLTSHSPQRVTIRLPKYVPMMDPVLVTARRNASLDRVGFNQRKRSGVGYYLGPDQLQKLHPNYLTDILRQIPGLRVTTVGFDQVVQSSRGVGSLVGGDCVQYVVDDMPWSSTEPGDINNFVNGNEVVAVEVYHGNAPPQYTRAMGDCVTIVLWTRFKIRDLKEK